MPNYPLIFDDRVANGLVKLMQPTVELFSMIHVSTLRQATAYTKFLRLAHQIAQDAQAQPDQVELFLFGQVS
jgi:hypothetical protein